MRILPTSLLALSEETVLAESPSTQKRHLLASVTPGVPVPECCNASRAQAREELAGGACLSVEWGRITQDLSTLPPTHLSFIPGSLNANKDAHSLKPRSSPAAKIFPCSGALPYWDCWVWTYLPMNPFHLELSLAPAPPGSWQHALDLLYVV